MCRLGNIAMRDYQESVTNGQTDGRTDAGQSDLFVPLCFAGDTTKKILFPLVPILNHVPGLHIKL